MQIQLYKKVAFQLSSGIDKSSPHLSHFRNQKTITGYIWFSYVAEYALLEAEQKLEANCGLRRD